MLSLSLSHVGIEVTNVTALRLEPARSFVARLYGYTMFGAAATCHGIAGSRCWECLEGPGQCLTTGCKSVLGMSSRARAMLDYWV